MGAGQFLRDYRRSTKTRKALAHRKMVLQRKQKAQTRSMKVHLPQIKQDRSPFKQVSHGRLVALVDHSKEQGLKKLYTKCELEKLCSAYGIDCRSSWNKSKLAQELSSSIRSNTYIPVFQVLNEFTVNAVPNDHNQQAIPRLILRLA